MIYINSKGNVNLGYDGTLCVTDSKPVEINGESWWTFDTGGRKVRNLAAGIDLIIILLEDDSVMYRSSLGFSFGTEEFTDISCVDVSSMYAILVRNDGTAVPATLEDYDTLMPAYEELPGVASWKNVCNASIAWNMDTLYALGVTEDGNVLYADGVKSIQYFPVSEQKSE